MMNKFNLEYKRYYTLKDIIRLTIEKKYIQIELYGFQITLRWS